MRLRTFVRFLIGFIVSKLIKLFFIDRRLTNQVFFEPGFLKLVVKEGSFIGQKKRIVICGGEAVRWALGFKGFLFSCGVGGDPLVFIPGYFSGKNNENLTYAKEKGPCTSMAG